ncbi:MAG: MarR family transcriptional regulator, partial [Xanthomonadales bacterium]|nr:MarR family transcriptional regulator [Xanthomonadales bacterium]
LTEKGRALTDAMWPAYRAAIAAHFSDKLDQADAEAMAALLEKLRPA